ncbi:MAG: addiction module protein [Planctomycetes bacterium]|nr:addiction module protein [Planctomycetota bacterium]MBU4399157.1 addiction module protein [Planctomycetota bacterium]MCG2682213.1 addiction module protein [Planctomycetales bacterium]
MDITLLLQEMSTADKLSVMELLWDDLSRSPENLPSPAWHGEVLAAREQMLKEGKTSFSEFTEVRDRLRKAVQ